MKNLYLNFLFNNWSNVLLFKSLYANYSYSSFFSSFHGCTKLFYSPSFKKLKFKGKGYYLYKGVRNTIAPQFGYSHRLYVYSYFSHLKFLGKTTVLFFGFYMHDLLTTSFFLKRLRNINIFTSRGVRFARQLLYKKQGKVSSYR
jgi:ribosomal protein L6P/L9E